MRTRLWACLVVLLSGMNVVAQQGAQAPQQANAYAADTKTLESTVSALYKVISGPAGARDWKRFEALFMPGAHLVYTGVSPEGKVVNRPMTVAGYEERAGPIMQSEAFFEGAISNHVDQFGNIAQVFSTYESRHEKDGAVFARGINSIQLMWDGQRWWVVSLIWDSERKDNPIPERYR